MRANDADSHLRSEALLKFEGTDAQITVLFLYWLHANSNISNSQTAKHMKDLHFNYEITLERLKYLQRNVTYNSVG